MSAPWYRQLWPWLLISGPAAVLMSGGMAWAQDPAPGRLLYETHCGGCHYERVHERTKSDVKGLADLRDTVARWAPQTKHRFTLDEIESVVQYLNESHYRFGLPPRRQRSDGTTK